ncbi:hypothetical protein P8452_12313 [Trifolium repens]|nr:hypothetical protein P8452_12313 [Trifolium repens]
MTQSSTHNSPATTSHNHPSPSQDNPSIEPSPVDIIDAIPLSTIHPSFASVLNPKPHKATSSSKSKSTKKPKATVTEKPKASVTKKPKVKKSKSRYSSDFDMQAFLLGNQDSSGTNVGSDAAATSQKVQIEENTVKIPNVEKGESTLETETVKSIVPNSPKDDGHDEDDTDAQIVEDVLQSLDKSVP